MRKILFPFCVFLGIFYTLKSYSNNCKKPFGYVERRLLDVSPSGIRKFFSNPQNLQMYNGVRGFLRFTNTYFKGRRYTAFNVVINKGLNGNNPEDTKKRLALGWLMFEDSIALLSHRNELKAFFSKPLNILRYKGLKGYIEFSAEFMLGDMKMAFYKVKKAVSPDIFNKLGWKLYKGYTHDFYNTDVPIPSYE